MNKECVLQSTNKTGIATQGANTKGATTSVNLVDKYKNNGNNNAHKASSLMGPYFQTTKIRMVMMTRGC
jgi:hypothetical protein